MSGGWSSQPPLQLGVVVVPYHSQVFGGVKAYVVGVYFVKGVVCVIVCVFGMVRVYHVVGLLGVDWWFVFVSLPKVAPRVACRARTVCVWCSLG